MSDEFSRIEEEAHRRFNAPTPGARMNKSLDVIRREVAADFERALLIQSVRLYQQPQFQTAQN
jgi:hypothetical protein